jgi:GT2 family glycosyltransferase
MLNSLLADLIGQTRRPDEIIIVDNSNTDITRTMIKRSFSGVRYIQPETNIGSAGGYAEGIKAACQKDDLIWLLDDDVSVGLNALEELLLWLNRLEQTEKVGAVRSWCAKVCDFETPRKTDSFAWRGTLIKASVAAQIGLPRTEYFLYADDTEYALRMTRRGYSIFWIPSSRVVENSSDDKIDARILGRKSTFYADEARAYYAFRNQIDVALRYHLWWQAARIFAYAAKTVLWIGLAASDNKAQKMRAVGNGLMDGLRGRLGRNERYLPREMRL